MKIVLISCVSKKINTESLAKDMYISSWFKYALRYSYSLNADKIFILSAKYGLLNLNDKIAPYELSINKMSTLERTTWGNKVLNDLHAVSNVSIDYFVLLAGKKYRENLLKNIKNYEAPLSKMGIGKQLQFMKNAVC